MSRHDRDYYRQRAETELEMARAATNAEARKAHRVLASHYLDLAASDPGQFTDQPSEADVVVSRPTIPS